MKRPFARLLIAVVCVGAGFVTFSVSGATPTSTIVLTVTTTADIVNGDVFSPAALEANPGPDGISLREAIMASNATPGPHAITFAPVLDGRIISPSTPLPAIVQDNTTLLGLTTANGQPGVTLSASQLSGCCNVLLLVEASGVQISHIGITGLQGSGVGIQVSPGQPGGELHLNDVSIEQNVLNNADQPGYGITIGPTGPHVPTGATLDNITIAGNVISGFLHDGINVGLLCNQCSLKGLVVEDNTFSGNTASGEPSLELDTSFAGNSILGTQIVRNTFTGNWVGVSLNGGGGFATGPNGSVEATGNSISSTVISQNSFIGNSQGIALSGGVSTNATNNNVSDTEISNNVFADNNPYGAIALYGGGGSDVSVNQVVGVDIVNDTIAYNDGGVYMRNNDGGATGNTISNVEVRNTIFWANGSDTYGPDLSTVVPTVITSLMGVDPLLVNAQDFHLQASSPAINAGTVNGAPTVDFADGQRDNAPDIGAYEFGAVARPRLDVYVEDFGGNGSVTSNPAGIACETTCEAAFDAQTAVTLTATPAVGSRFAGWTGSCSGTGNCSLILAAASTATATFSMVLTPTTTTSTTAPKKTVPGAPLIHVSSTSKGSISISVAGDVRNAGSPISKYQCSLNGKSWVNVSKNSHGVFVIGHLISHKTYSVRLRAINGAGAGDPSNAVKVKVK